MNLFSANPTKWSNTLKKNRRLLPRNCLSVFYHFVELAYKGSREVNPSNIKRDFKRDFKRLTLNVIYIVIYID